MGFLSDLVSWFGEPGRWAGDDGILPRALEHLWLAALPMLIAVTVALPKAPVLTPGAGVSFPPLRAAVRV